MKKLLLTLLLVLSLGLLLVGCSSTSNTTTTTTDDKEDTEMTTSGTENEDIIGTWSQYSENNDIAESVSLTLNDDGTFELLEEISESGASVNDVPLTGTYKATDDTLTLDFDEPADIDMIDGDEVESTKFEYKLEDDELVLTGEDGTVFNMKKDK